MMARWLALALLLLLPLRALAENCTFSMSGDWTSATAYSGTDDCTLDATDNVTIESGVTATVVLDATVTDVDVAMTTGTITVASGGTLIVEGAGGLGVPNGGVVVQSGGTFQPRGSAVSYGDATPTLVSSLSDGGGADVNTVLPVGKVIHCPGTPVGTLAATTSTIVTDCDGSEAGTAGARSQVAICYPDSDIAAERLGGFQHATAGHAGEGFYPEWLGQVAVGDVVVFWDSTNQNPSRDVNAMYEIEFINTSSLNRCIGLNVRQGSTESSCEATALNCHLTERDIREATLQAAYVAGQRTVSVDTAVVTANSQRVGHFLTCPLDYTSDGVIEPGSTQTVAITQTTTGATDTLRLMPGGFRAGVPNGSVCWIDYGWQQGDPISVFRPARLENIQNATCVADNNPVTCCDATGIGTCGPVTCQRGSTCDMDFALLHRLGKQSYWPGVTATNTWLRELNSIVMVHLNEGPGPFTRLQLTSPATLTASSEGHGFTPNGSGTTTILDSVARHWGDDLFVSNTCIATDGLVCNVSVDPSPTNVYGLDLKRFRAEYHGCAGGSCSVWDEGQPAGGATQFRATDILLRDAVQHGNSQPAFYLMNGETAGSMVMRNSTWIGSGGQTHIVYNSSNSRLELRNFYDIGRVLGASFTTPLWRANVLTDGSIIEPQSTGAAGYWMTNIGIDGGSGSQRWERILVLDPDAPAANPIYGVYVQDAESDLSVTDFAMISANRTGQATANHTFRIGSDISSTNYVRLNRMTVALRPGEATEWLTGIYASGTDATFDNPNGYRKLQNGLAAFFWNVTSSGAAMGGDATDSEFVTSPWCFTGNDNDTGFGATLTSPSVRDTRQPFVNPWVGNFEPKKDSLFWDAGCGARKVGARDMWALRVLGHDIYAGYGDTWKRPSGGGGKRGPRATP